jgi:hypothetical protein
MTPPLNVHSRVYDKNERKAIDPFKTEYLSTTTPAQRKEMAQGRIFPALFSYWSSIGVDLNPNEMDRRSDVSTFKYTSILFNQNPRYY